MDTFGIDNLLYVVHNDINIMSAAMVKRIPYLPHVSDNNTIVFVKSTNPPTVDGFVYLLHGTLVNIGGDIKEILQIILSYVDINTFKIFPNQENILQQIKQFTIAHMVTDSLSIDLRLSKSVPTSDIMVANENINMAVENGDGKLTCLFTPELAHTLSPLVQEGIETSGKIFIQNYNSKNEAVMAFHKDFLVTGNFDSVLVPDAPFSFHTHPDECAIDRKCYIAWPSGGDMYMIILKFFKNSNVLAHFVVTSEGVWVIHVSIPFQKMIEHMKVDESCALQLLDVLFHKFTSLEWNRTHNIDPILRASAKEWFENFVSNYKISDLFVEYPTLQESNCNVFVESDSSLFNINLIEWESIRHTSLPLTFYYAVNENAGFPPYMPPDFIPAIMEKIST